MKLRRR